MALKTKPLPRPASPTSPLTPDAAKIRPRVALLEHMRLMSPSSWENVTCECVSIIRIRQRYTVDPAFVQGDQAVGHCLVHELAGAFELRLAEVLALFQHSADPLVVDSVCSTSAEQIDESQAKEKIAD